MSGRATAEIVADLRSVYGVTRFAAAIEAADRLAALDTENDDLAAVNRNLGVRADRLNQIDALRLPCPTCGGSGKAIYSYDRDDVDPCPDCTDGRMSHERAWKIVAAVFDPNLDPTKPEHRNPYTDLRGIR